jgi:serine/threonine protein kinase
MTEETIVAQALGMAVPAERAAFLERACAGDAALRERVEALLRCRDGTGVRGATGVHTPSGDGSDAPPDAGEWPGSNLGPYTLVRRLGEGGMGVVYLAEQTEPVRRQVAVKVIKPGLDSREVVARFEAERQALALMDHPNIARIIDGGTTEAGRSFFVMELVQGGVPITRYCDEHRLTMRQRLELFLPVCQAVQHAHQKGIIHRDVNPNNVLVADYDGKPVPKVIDFGVAKVTGPRLDDQTLFTLVGAIVGTLEYMSPEQAEIGALGVDTRSDIYSLGVLLYELLTGTTPLDRQRLRQATLGEIMRLIREEEPPRPSTRLSRAGDQQRTASERRRTEPGKLARLLRGELDWVVMKCLEKDRGRRYESASALARDLERYLADEPVEACPPSAIYRLGKVVRKHRTLLATAAAFVLLLLAGTVVSVWQAVRATAAQEETAHEQRKTQAALDQLTEQQRRTTAALEDSTRSRARARAALNTLTDEVVDKLFGRRDRLGDDEKAFLRRVQGYYEGYAAEQGQTAEAREVRAEGRFRLAQMRALLGEPGTAEADLRELVRAAEGLVADFPTEPSYRRGLAAAHDRLGTLLGELGRHKAAEAAHDRALVSYEKLVADHPRVLRYRRDLAQGLQNRAILLAQVAKRSEAEKDYRRAVALLAEVAKYAPAAADVRQDLALCQGNLGTLLNDLGRRGEAETVLRRALALLEELVARAPGVTAHRRELARCLSNLGIVLPHRGKEAEAEKVLRRSVALCEELFNDFPSLPASRQELARRHNNLSDVLLLRGKRDEAADSLRRAIRLYEGLIADRPAVPSYRQGLASSLGNLGNALDNQGKHGDAEAAHRKAIAQYEALVERCPAVPEYRLQLAGCHVNLGNAIRSQNRSADAVPCYGKAVPLLEALLAQDGRLALARLFLRNAHWNRAQALRALGRHAEAARDWGRAAALADGNMRDDFRLFEADALVRSGDHVGGTALAEELTRTGMAPGAGCFNAALVYGLAATVSRGNAALREKYAARAVALLRQARQEGFFEPAGRVGSLRRSTALASLRDRPDYQKLLTELDPAKK